MTASNSAPDVPAPALDVSKLLGRIERTSKVTLAADAPRTPAGAYGSAYVTTGSRPVGDQSEDVLVIVDGSSRLAFPASAVASAILHGVVPREVIRALWAAADAA